MNNKSLAETKRCYHVQGGTPLRGRIQTEGMKNAVLPLMAASLLTDEPLELNNVPAVEDVHIMASMLTELGKKISITEDVYLIEENGNLQPNAPYELVRRMRASFNVLGPLLARLGQAKVPLPGGCILGPRPVDFHIKGLQSLGAKIELQEGVFHAEAKQLKGTDLYLDFPSVGATMQLLSTAALIPEKTVIYNPAQEPEVYELIYLLKKMGANISIAPDRIEIIGQPKLNGASYRVIPDRINAGTYLIAGAISGGEIIVECIPGHLEALLVKLREMGFAVEEHDTEVRLVASGRAKGIHLETRTYPGFACDIHPQMMALMALAEGDSLIRETVLADRFGQVPELIRMGANIKAQENTAFIKGVEQLQGTEVYATDIRSGAALILAGLAAKGETRMVDSGHVARGYVDLAGKLSKVGASIEVEYL